MSYQPGDTIVQMFYHSTGGLTQSGFTSTLFRDGAESGNEVTITEVTTNFYKASFNTDTTDDVLWELDIIETGNTDERLQGSWRLQKGIHADITQDNGEDFSASEVIAELKSLMDDIHYRFGS